MTSTKHILIIEDEILHARKLQSQLEELGYPNTTVCRNDKEALPLIDKGNFDLAMVDIGLENSDMNGIALAKKIKSKHNVPVIFITSFSDKSSIQETAKTSPSNYLVKPVPSRQLLAAVEHAFLNKKITELSTNISSDCPFKTTKDTIFVGKINNDFHDRIHVDDIIHIKASGSYCHIVTEKDSHTISTSLSSFLKQFPHPNVIRVHRSHAVNNKKVIARSSYKLRLSNQELIPFSAKYRSVVEEYFDYVKTD